MNKQNARINKKTKALAIILGLIVVLGLLTALLKAINSWYEKNTFVFNRPVTIDLKAPIQIKERQIEVKEIVRVISEIPHPQDLETDTEKYIYEKFGIEDYKVAIAIAKSESGLREEAFNINSNGTIDVGIFQINSIHYKKDGCSLKEVATMNGNIDCAYSIYEDQGWKPWVVFNNGAFINKL